MSEEKMFYKYLSPDGIDILQNLRILVQDPNNFNDPFEVSAGVGDLKKEVLKDNIRGDYGKGLFERRKHQLPDKSFEEFRERALNDEKTLNELCKIMPKNLHGQFFEVKKKLGRDLFGAICFCSKDMELDKEILVWSHYTDSHKGLRILFDISKIELLSKSFCKVDYLNKRPLLIPFSVKNDFKASDEIFRNCLTSKSKAWSYEREYRWLIDYKECHFEYDGKGVKRHYIEIKPNAIIGVDVGVSMSVELKEAIKTCLNRPHLKHIVMREAEIDRKGYALNYDLVSV